MRGIAPWRGQTRPARLVSCQAERQNDRPTKPPLGRCRTKFGADRAADCAAQQFDVLHRRDNPILDLLALEPAKGVRTGKRGQALQFVVAPPEGVYTV